MKAFVTFIKCLFNNSMVLWTVDFLLSRGLFATVHTVALCFWHDPQKLLLYQQDKMRRHLISCLESGQFTRFPSSVNTQQKKSKTQKKLEFIAGVDVHIMAHKC